MKDEAIKNAMDANVEDKAKDLIMALEYAARGIEGLLKDMRQDMFVERPCSAAVTLQALAASAAKYAVTARVYAAQLVALKCVQEAANAEYTGEEKA